MGRHRILVMAAGLLLAAPLRAGFYDPARPASLLVTPTGVRPLHPDQFRDELDRLTAIADPLKPQGPRALVVKERDDLLARGNLGATDLAALGAIQWRLRDGESALTTLKQATSRDPRNFWALTHLGSVQQSLGQLRDALPYLESARDLFPEPWPGGAAA